MIQIFFLSSYTFTHLYIERKISAIFCTKISVSTDLVWRHQSDRVQRLKRKGSYFSKVMHLHEKRHSVTNPILVNSSNPSLSDNSGVMVPSAASVYHPLPVIFYFLDLFLPPFSKYHLLYPFLLSLDSSFSLSPNKSLSFLS